MIDCSFIIIADFDLGTDEDLHAEPRDGEHRRWGEVSADLQLVPQMSQRQKQVQTSSRLASHCFHDQNDDVIMIIFKFQT